MSARTLLWLSLPIALLALAASAAGLLSKATYARETAVWAAQAVGQDAVNLAVYPAFLWLAALAGRGSLKAYLVWLGLLLYSTYSYFLYAAFVHFGPWFLAYVAVLGLSTYALIGGLVALDPARVRDAFEPSPVHLVAGFLIAAGVIFSLLWILEIVGATLAGRAPQGAVDTGLPVNPVHVLDLAFLLPALILAGAWLLRRRALGYVLAPVLLTNLGVLGVAILGMLASMDVRGLPVTWGVAALFGATTALSLGLLRSFLSRARGATPLSATLRG